MNEESKEELLKEYRWKKVCGDSLYLVLVQRTQPARCACRSDVVESVFLVERENGWFAIGYGGPGSGGTVIFSKSRAELEAHLKDDESIERLLSNWSDAHHQPLGLPTSPKRKRNRADDSLEVF